MSDPANFYTLIFTQSSLYMNQALESSVAKIVNEAFSEIENFKNGVRYEKDEDVSKELGDTGIISIAFDPMPGAGRDLPVACISAKEYVPPKIEGEVVDPSKPSYRLYAVATLSNPVYRKKGLIPLCLSALKSALPANSQLWIETAEESNGPYWRHRGFEQIASERKAAGFWGASKEFEWICLRK